MIKVKSLAIARLFAIRSNVFSQSLAEILRRPERRLLCGWLKDICWHTNCCKVYLLRNERQLHIYSFEGGERFEPDYLLFLHSPKGEGYEQLQVFIEPKGTHLIKTDKWKEDFLLEIEGTAVSRKVYVDDNDYKIWGFHFFNQDVRATEFDYDIKKLYQ